MSSFDWPASASGGGSSTFLGLTDTPSAFSSQSLKVARVNAGENALEFATISGTGDVVAASNFGTDNVLTKSDGVNKGVQSTGIVVDDSNNVSAAGTIASGALTPSSLTASRALQASAGKTIESSAVTNTELGYVSGVSSAIQTQLDAKGTGNGDVVAASNFGTDNVIVRSDGTSKGVQSSAIAIDDSDNLTGVTSIDIDGTTESTSTTTGSIKTAGGIGALKNVVSGGQIGSTITDDGNSGTSQTIDFNDSNVHFVDMTGNVTFTLSNPISGFAYQLILKQDATGSRTATWPAGVKWPGGTAPTLSTAANSIDIVSLVYSALDSEYYAVSQLAFS